MYVLTALWLVNSGLLPQRVGDGSPLQEQKPSEGIEVHATSMLTHVLQPNIWQGSVAKC